MPKFKFGKLIRDNLPYMNYFRGIRTLDSSEFVDHLKKKLIEEAEELLDCNTSQSLMEEIADVLEVLEELIKVSHLDLDHIRNLQQEKKRKRGGFEKRLFVDHIEVSEGSDLEKYYLDRPQKYPKIE